MMTLTRLSAAVAVAALLAGCAASEEKQPEIGYKTDEYKKSPCACLEVPLRGPDPRLMDWFRSRAV